LSGRSFLTKLEIASRFAERREEFFRGHRSLDSSSSNARIGVDRIGDAESQKVPGVE